MDKFSNAYKVGYADGAIQQAILNLQSEYISRECVIETLRNALNVLQAETAKVSDNALQPLLWCLHWHLRRWPDRASLHFLLGNSNDKGMVQMSVELWRHNVYDNHGQFWGTLRVDKRAKEIDRARLWLSQIDAEMMEENPDENLIRQWCDKVDEILERIVTNDQSASCQARE